MIAATIRTGAPKSVEKMIPMIGMAMRAPSSPSQSSWLWCRLTVVLGTEMLKWRFNFLETLRSMESSSSGVAATAGEMFAPALAVATAVAETAGVGDCPKAGRASTIEQRQVKIANFIVVLCE
jgi:hypothetical protein